MVSTAKIMLDAYETAEQYIKDNIPELMASDIYVGFSKAIEEAQERGLLDAEARAYVMKHSARFAAKSLDCRREARKQNQ